MHGAGYGVRRLSGLAKVEGKSSKRSFFSGFYHHEGHAELEHENQRHSALSRTMKSWIMVLVSSDSPGLINYTDSSAQFQTLGSNNNNSMGTTQT